MKIVGLDLSLTSTGVAVLNFVPSVGFAATGYWDTKLYRVRSNPVTPDPGLADRLNRISNLHARIVRHTGACPPGTRGLNQWPDLAVIEAPAYGAKFGDPHDRSGLWHKVVTTLHDAGVPIAEVAPPVLKKYATGSGATRGPNKVEKADVMKAVKANFGPYVAAQVDGNDTADAFVLAAMGARALGYPLETNDRKVSAASLATMSSVRWP